jgi:hypothetical protein
VVRKILTESRRVRRPKREGQGYTDPQLSLALPAGSADDARPAQKLGKELLEPCRIVVVGKRRDGGTRYWCLEHKADATAKYGRRAAYCRYAHQDPLRIEDILGLDIRDYPGGIALWGAVPPVYDTTRLPLERGIHVHARHVAGTKKAIDRTFRAVRLTGDPHSAPDGGNVLSELE